MTGNYSDKRRFFLKSIALLGGAAACIPMAKKALPTGEQPKLLTEKPAQGYRQTEHVNKYYQTLKS